MKVRTVARCVHEDKCTGCGACTRQCVIAGRIPDEWNEGRGTRGAACIPFIQAAFRVAIIEAENFLLFTRGRRKQKFPEACRRGAIDFDMKDGVPTLEVCAMMVATGLIVYDPHGAGEYGYCRFDNVTHGTEYKRLRNACAPTGGHPERRSAGQRPKRIACTQCPGARLEKRPPLRCSVCCMYATMGATPAFTHHDDTENYLFCAYIRAFGRGFDEYIWKDREEHKIEYTGARPNEMTEDPPTGNFFLWYDDKESGEVKSMEVDMVVLSTAFVPSPGKKDLAEVWGVEADEYGFFNAADGLFDPMDTRISDIFIKLPAPVQVRWK